MNIQERIEKLEKELAALKIEASVKPWEPEGGSWFVNAGGLIHEGFRTLQHREFGTERPTENLAERASLMMRRFNRLLAYHDEFCPEHDPLGFFDSDTNNYYVYYESGEWRVGAWRFINININGIYFPQEIVIELCRKLNEGEVVL